MNYKRCRLRLATICAISLFPSHVTAQQFSFNDVDYWVGSGTQRAAMLIDWVDDVAEPPALAWGYRWDGTATGYDMLLAIVSADDRLFAKYGDFFGTPVVYGFGYDTDADGEFGVLKIDLNGDPIETVFNEAGFAYSEIPDDDRIRALATDPGDFYGEGWRSYFWHYGNESLALGGVPTNPFDGGSWIENQSGMLGRPLQDGSWDSWAYEKIPTQPPFIYTAYAENPIAAAPPFLPGDYNRDERVDDADYQLWKSEFGSTTAPAVDGNGNGIVDAADYTIWRNHLGAGIGSSAVATAAPEPNSILLALWTLCALWLIPCFRQKVKVS